MKNVMPEIDLANADLNDVEMTIAMNCLNKGRLRASKPNDGDAAYVWRNVAFFISPVQAHQCMPVMAFCYVNKVGDGKYDTMRARETELNKIVDAMVDAVPKKNWNGVMKWKNVLGYTG